MVSPMFKPRRISTRLSVAAPSVTGYGTNFPSALRTNTKLRSPVASTAERGTLSTVSVVAEKRMVAYMPGLRAASGFGSSTRMRAVRVSGFMVG